MSQPISVQDKQWIWMVNYSVAYLKLTWVITIPT